MKRFTLRKITVLLLVIAVLLFIAALLVGGGAQQVASKRGSPPLYLALCLLLAVPEMVWLLRRASLSRKEPRPKDNRSYAKYGAFLGLVLVIVLNTIDSRYPHSRLAAYAAGIIFAVALPPLLLFWLLLWRYRIIIVAHQQRRS